jgi:hypothetical protein
MTFLDIAPVQLRRLVTAASETCMRELLGWRWPPQGEREGQLAERSV